LSAISFARGSDALAPEANPILDQVAALLKSHKEITRVGVAGHASAEEKDPEGLSARRAAAVRLALQQRGVTTGPGPRAYGATRPLDTGATDAARAHNRRTEFSIDAGAGGEASDVKLKNLERRTEELKEQIRRSKTRQGLLHETVLSSGSVEHAAAASPKDI